MTAEINLVAALASFSLVVAIALRQLDRVMRHRLMGRDSPDLLIRDTAFFWALVVLFVLPAIASAFGHTLSNYLWWVIVRSIVGVGVLALWAYYEFAVVGRDQE